MSDQSHDERDPDSTDGRGRLDVEAAFADIVAHWDDASHGPVGSWPAQEDIDPHEAGVDIVDPKDNLGTLGTQGTQGTPETPDTLGRQDGGRAGDSTGTDDSPAPMSFSAYDGPHVPLAPVGWSPREELPEAESEGYVPPEPPPLPRGDTVGWLAWIAVLGGPVFLMLASLWWTDIGRLWIMIAVLAFIAGFAAIVARLPNHRSDDGPDDGAVV